MPFVEFGAGALIALLAVALLRCRSRKPGAAERLQAVTLASIGDAVIATDLVGAITYMNPEAERLTGWSRYDAVGRPVGDVVALVRHDTRTPVPTLIGAVLRDGQPRMFCNHTLLVARNGTEIPIEQKASPIRSEVGSSEGAVLVFRDCTDRRRAEEALRDRIELREQLASIAETAPGLIYSYRLRRDGSAHFPYASGKIIEVFGVTPADLAVDAQQAWRLIHPEDAEAMRASVAQSAASMNLWRAEFRVNHPETGMRWIEAQSTPVREPDGSILWRGFMMDVTARKASEAALHESEERFRQIAETIREGFWLSDPDRRTMLYASPAFECIWGRSFAAMQESPGAWLDAIHPGDQERAARAFADAREAPCDVEYRVIRPDGTTRWVRDRAFPVRNNDGEIVRIAGVAEDITERRQLEGELRHAQRMESIGLLAGGVAHDFNNALAVILGSAELLEERMAADAEAAALADEIRKATERASGLTRQLLAFSRKEVVAPRVVDVNALVSETEKMLKRLLGEDIVIEASLDPELPPAYLDPGQWEQVLMNLSVNARDAMPNGGTLRIETRRSERAGAALLQLSVSDTGCGMTADVMSRIFEPFFTTKGVGRGTGLGLAVVYGIVKQSGGEIEVRSEPNAGTTFVIHLPAASEPETQAHSSRKRSADGAGGTETILVVEDEASLRRMAARILSRLGYSVLEAENGAAALDAVSRHDGRVDLLLTDVVMPGMDGRELMEKLRGSRPGLRVLFSSGYTEDAVVHRGVETARVAFLQKPYSPSTLASKVREVLDGADG